MTYAVNVFNGNLTVTNYDLAIAGTGLAVAENRTYNAQAASASNDFGFGWVGSTANDVKLVGQSDGSQTLYGPTGYTTTFASNGQGGFTSPTAIDSTLTRNSDSTLTLKGHRSEGSLTFSSAGALLFASDRDNNRVICSYGNGRLSSVTDTQGRTIQLAYGASGLINTVTDPSGSIYRYSYNARGELASYTDPTNATTAYLYDGNHRLTQITSPAGRTVTFAYDANGRMVRSTRGSSSVSYTYSAGRTTVTDPTGRSTTMTFDGVGRVVKRTDALGRTNLRTSTADSNVSSFRNAAGGEGAVVYDSLDNPISLTLNNGLTLQRGYGDPAHPWSPTTVSDPTGNVTTLTYNAAGHIVTARDSLPTSNQQSAVYNPNGTIASITDHLNGITTFGYDTRGNLTDVIPPAPLGPVHNEVDSLSRVTRSTDGKGQTTTLTYDALNRVKTAAYADGSTASNSYDADGNLLTQDTPGFRTSFVYDSLNRLTQKTVNGVSVSATYDAAGNLTSVTDAGGTVKYAYDAVRLLTSATDATGHVTTFSYDAMGRRTGTTYPNGMVTAVAYDSGGRATAVTTRGPSGNVISGSTISYRDPATGRSTALRYSMTDESGNVTSYTYDQLNRLVRSRTTSGSTQVADYQYTYDGNGNRLTSTINGVTSTYSYNAANELVSSGGVTYTYDADGNLISDSTGFLQTFNAANQVTSVQQGAGQPTIPMTYVGVGQTQRSAAGSTSFLNGLQGVTGVTDSSGTTYYTRDGHGHLLGSRGPSGQYYYAFDAGGSVVALTDSSGAVVNRYAYDPYGSTGSGTVEAVANPWKFQGGYLDQSGLYKFGDRYEKPEVGRWTQQDSAPGSARTNQYAFANNQPVTLRDPSGHGSGAPGDPCAENGDTSTDYDYGQSSTDGSAPVEIANMGGNPENGVAIGQNADEVIAYAQEHNMGYFAPDPSLSPEELMAQDVTWTQDVMAAGYDVYEVTAPNSEEYHPYYDAEIATFGDYPITPIGDGVDYLDIR